MSSFLVITVFAAALVACTIFSQDAAHRSATPATEQRLSGSVIVVPLLDRATTIPEAVEELVRFTSAADGVLFDIDADGTREQVAWPERDAPLAFLAIDRNSNGTIDDGSELFGAQMLPGVPDGFTALAKISSNNGDGALTQEDSVYARLVLWRDENRNGRSESAELVPVSKVIAKIGLGYISVDRDDAHGNRLESRGWSIFVSEFKDRGNDPISPIYEVAVRSTR